MKNIWILSTILSVISSSYVVADSSSKKGVFQLFSVSVIQSVTNQVAGITNAAQESALKRSMLRTFCPPNAPNDGLPSGLTSLSDHCRYLSQKPLLSRIQLRAARMLNSSDSRHEYDYRAQCAACDQFNRAYKELVAVKTHKKHENTGLLTSSVFNYRRYVPGCPFA